MQRHGDEAYVHEVQDAVLCATDIHIYGEPFASEFGIPGLGLIIVRWVAQEIPGRVQEVIVDICLAASGLTANGTGSINKALDRCQRRYTCALWHPVFYIG